MELNQQKNGLFSWWALSMNASAALQKLFIHGGHARLVERARVLDLLLAHPAETRILGRVVLVGREGVQHAARAEFGFERGILRVVGVLRLLLGVEVVEIAEEFVEPVDRRQELVAVAQVVLAELAGHVVVRLEQVGQGRVFFGQPLLGARQADLEQTGAEGTTGR